MVRANCPLLGIELPWYQILVSTNTIKNKIHEFIIIKRRISMPHLHHRVLHRKKTIDKRDHIPEWVLQSNFCCLATVLAKQGGVYNPTKKIYIFIRISNL